MTTQRFDPGLHPREERTGQFATKFRGEAGGTDVLTAEPDEDHESLGIDLSDPKVVEHVKKMAVFESRKYADTFGSIDSSEVAADTFVDLAHDVRMRQAAVQKGGPREPIKNWEAYVRMVARNVAYRSNNGTGHDAQCRKLYLIARDTRTSDLGRGLTSIEEDEIAEKVAEGRPPGRRPKDGYHRTPVVTGMVGDDANRLANTARQTTVTNEDEFDDDSLPADVMRQASSSDLADQAEARRRVWDALAVRRGDVPTVEVATRSEYAAAQARKTVNSSGGALRVAQSWERGEATADDEAALFMPFSDEMTPDEKQSVVDLLADYPRSADDIYDAAVGQATRRRT